MENFKTLATERFSLRKYADIPIEQSKLDYIFDCVRSAPSAHNNQPVSFLLVKSAKMLALIKSCYNRDWINSVPMCFVALGLHNESWHRPSDNKDHADIDVAIAVDHLTLAAAEQGLGTCWICNFDVEKCRNILNLSSEIEPIALIPIGYAADNCNVKNTLRKPLEQIFKVL